MGEKPNEQAHNWVRFRSRLRGPGRIHPARALAGQDIRPEFLVLGTGKTLITKVGKGGGFILDGAASIPDEANPANVMAMAKSVQKYAN